VPFPVAQPLSENVTLGVFSVALSLVVGEAVSVPTLVKVTPLIASFPFVPFTPLQT
jgi:hypothetical protein